MKKVLKAIWNWFVFLLGGNGEIRKQSVDEGLCDLSGQGSQGRDKYGH